MGGVRVGAARRRRRRRRRRSGRRQLPRPARPHLSKRAPRHRALFLVAQAAQNHENEEKGHEGGWSRGPELHGERSSACSRWEWRPVHVGARRGRHSSACCESKPLGRCKALAGTAVPLRERGSMTLIDQCAEGARAQCRQGLQGLAGGRLPPCLGAVARGANALPAQPPDVPAVLCGIRNGIKRV